MDPREIDAARKLPFCAYLFMVLSRRPWSFSVWRRECRAQSEQASSAVITDGSQRALSRPTRVIRARVNPPIYARDPAFTRSNYSRRREGLMYILVFPHVSSSAVLSSPVLLSIIRCCSTTHRKVIRGNSDHGVIPTKASPWKSATPLRKVSVL